MMSRLLVNIRSQLLEALLTGCLGLHSLSYSIVSASLAFFCLLQILFSGPNCEQGCLRRDTLEAGNYIINSYGRTELRKNLIARNQTPDTELLCR